MQEVLQLIKKFLDDVETGLKLFDRKYGRRDIMTMLHDKIISRHGKLEPNVEYHIHGIGCIFEYPDYGVNFDFGPGFRSDGFCVFTLRLYATYFPKQFPHCQDKTELKRKFDNLINEGFIGKDPSNESELFFLTAKGKTTISQSQ